MTSREMLGAYQAQNDCCPGGGSNLSGGASGSICSASHSINNPGQNKILVASSAQQASTEEQPKNHFQTREGTYKLMTWAEYCRPSRVPLNPHQGNNVAGSSAVKVSFVSLPDTDDPSGFRDYLCFNSGRDVYVYCYGGMSKEITDLRNPVDKRIYKGTVPTCHDFNQANATQDSCALIIGFSAGQLQLIDSFRKDKDSVNKLYNEERVIDKTRVTCVRWVPGAPNQFLVAHGSGNMYVYNEELPCLPVAPVYQIFKQGEGFAVFTCKAKSSRNPLYKWTIGDNPMAINEFAFSPDGRLLAVVGQDGFLRIFNYHSMELIGAMRSYFGGLQCVAWSPDMKYVATGGEDDLVSVYSVLEKRLVCRGYGHKSWVSQVAFDPYLTLVYGPDGSDMHLDSEEDLRSLNLSSADLSTPLCTYQQQPPSAGQYQHYYNQAPPTQSQQQQQQQQPGGGQSQQSGGPPNVQTHLQQHRLSSSFRFIGRRGQKESINSSGSSLGCLSYRLGSVGHDTNLCFWDLTEDVLKPVTAGRIRTSALFSHSPLNPIQPTSSHLAQDGLNHSPSDECNGKKSGGPGQGKNSKDENRKEQGGGLKNKRYFINLRGGDKQHNNAANNNTNGAQVGQKSAPGHNVNSPHQANPNSDLTPTLSNPNKLLGSSYCPRLQEIPVIEPLICKKITHDRLTQLIFREDALVTACMEGFVYTWARPGSLRLSHQHSINSPNPGGSPHILPGGTIV